MYWLYPSEAQAEAAQRLILLLGSRALATAQGVALGADGVVTEGIRDGARVPAVITRWDTPRQCAEGWAIAAPYDWHIAPGVRLWTATMPGDPAATAAALGLPPLDLTAPATGEAWTLAVMAAAGLPVTEIAAPTWPEVL